MARKKVSRPQAPTAISNSERETHNQRQNVAELENLKSLNHILMKETMEMRQQVKTLNSNIDDLSLLSFLQEDFLLSLLSHLRESWACESGNMENAIEESEKRNAELRGEVKRLSLEMGAMEKNLKEEIGVARMDGEAKLMRVMELEKDNGDLKKKVTELNEGCQALGDVRVELERKLEDVEKDRRLLVESEKRLESKVAQLEMEVGLIAERERVACKKALELERTNGELLERKDTLRSELSGLENRVGLMREEVGAKVLRISELEKRNVELGEEVDGLVLDVGMLKEKIDLLRRNEEESALKRVGMEKERERLRRKVAELTESLNRQMEEGTEKARKYELAVEEKAQKVDKLAEKLKGVEKLKVTHERQLAELRKNVKGLKSKAEEVEVLNHELESSLEACKKRSGLWGWMSFASTVITAITIAYAAKSH